MPSFVIPQSWVLYPTDEKKPPEYYLNRPCFAQLVANPKVLEDYRKVEVIATLIPNRALKHLLGDYSSDGSDSWREKTLGKLLPTTFSQRIDSGSYDAHTIGFPMPDTMGELKLRLFLIRMGFCSPLIPAFLKYFPEDEDADELWYNLMFLNQVPYHSWWREVVSDSHQNMGKFGEGKIRPFHEFLQVIKTNSYLDSAIWAPPPKPSKNYPPITYSFHQEFPERPTPQSVKDLEVIYNEVLVNKYKEFRKKFVD